MEAARNIEEIAKEADERFERLAADFANDDAVTRGSNRGFCSGALKVNGKVFAFISARGQYIVKLQRDRAAALVNAGLASPFDPGHGRPMKEWVVIPPQSMEWPEFAREARRFVGDSVSHNAD